MEHLIELGHRRIALLTGPAGVFTARERAVGYRQALRAADIPYDESLVFFGPYTVAGGVALAEQVLALDPHPTAIFAANNFLAAGALHTAHQHGLHVPGDISLVSFDDLPIEYMAEPFLTVVKQPAYELGATAARLLLARLAEANGRPCQEIVLPTELVIRSSTAAPKVSVHL
jgi:DNA-binding LacI/PurR family transcriptional regulator